MSNAIQHFGIIYNNPFVLGPVFPSFFKSLGKKPKGFLLSYLVLPLVLYPSSRTFLLRSRSTSTIRTLMSKRERIYGLNERIAEYWGLTNKSFQHAVDIGILEIDETLSVNVVSDFPLDTMFVPDPITAAGRLGLLFNPFDVPTVYRMLGVKKI